MKEFLANCPFNPLLGVSDARFEALRKTCEKGGWFQIENWSSWWLHPVTGY
jgi:hypothetical protein